MALFNRSKNTTDTAPAPARPATTKGMSPRDAIQWAFHVPDHLRDDYDAITEEEVGRRIVGQGVVLDIKEEALSLAKVIVRQEFPDYEQWYGRFPGEDKPVDARFNELIEYAAGSIYAGKWADHKVRLEIASGKHRVRTGAARQREIDRRTKTDPISGAYSRTSAFGTTQRASIIPRMSSDGGGAWATVRANDLTRHLVSVLFAQRLLEQNVDLATAVEAEVQRLLDAMPDGD